MPGLVGLALRESGSLDRAISEMLRRTAAYPWQRPAHQADQAAGVSLGVVTLEPHAGSALAVSDDGRWLVAAYGELYEADGRRAGGGTGIARTILSGWAVNGASSLADLSGEFAALIWDAVRQEFHVITDRFGLRPVYVAEAAAGFAAASEIKAVLVLPGVDRAWSEAGIAQFFSFGHFYGSDTLLRGVRTVPAATVATFSAATRRYEERPYWRQSAPSPAPASDDQLRTELDDRFVAAVERRARPGERVGLSLSGGLDARTILGVVPGGVDLQTVSLGIDGSLDHRSAAELASLAGVRHHQYLLDTSFLASFETHLRQMVRLTDGHYLDQGIVMPTMETYRRIGIDYLLRGHGGELLHMRKAYAFSLDDAVLRASETGLRTWLLSHLTDYMLRGVPADLFRIDLRAGAEAALDAALARTTPVERPVDRVWQLFLNERLRRETPLSMHVFGNFATVRQPYIDNDVVDVLLRMPARLKLGDELQTALLRRRRPEFLAVTNSNTGAPLGAGRIATEIARLRLRVGAKLGWKGYQPYERLGLWLRRELRDLVLRTLGGERLLDDTVVRADVVRRIVTEHLDERANHTFLIMSLLIFALGRELVIEASGDDEAVGLAHLRG